MKKDKILGCRFDEDTLNFIKEQSNKCNKTMSEWIRKQISIKKGSSKHV
jgi:hypothetical protein